MTKISQERKQEINGGLGPMMLWVIITGAVMAISTLSSLAASAGDSNSGGSNNNSNTAANSKYVSSSKSHGYLRISPFPARSAWMMPI